MITKVSKNNSNKSKNEHYNLESIFEKLILWIWTCQKPSDAQQKSKHSVSIFCIIHFRMSPECFRRFPICFSRFLNIYMGHNFSNDITPKNEVVRSGLKFGWLEIYLMVLLTKKFFSFWRIFSDVGGVQFSDFWWEACSSTEYNLFLFS